MPLEIAVSSSASPLPVAALPDAVVIEVQGIDAAKVLHNLSTNDVLKLAEDQTLESFITDARGWVVAHVGVIKQHDRLWLLGSHNAPHKICQHIDRYIIREDARVVDHSATHGLLVGEPSTATNPELSQSSPLPPLSCPLPILAENSVVQVIARDVLNNMVNNVPAKLCTAEEFDWLRISNFWPLQSLDIPDKTIPQELGRDQRAISFTKGCYLGQETIARLDARGQLQKKLCLIELHSDNSSTSAGVPELAVGDALWCEDKQVGTITSLAHDPQGIKTRALAFVRRGHFEPGSILLWQQRPAQVLRS